MTQKSKSNSGLLAGVFSFVSREFDSFVTNASGGKVAPDDDSSQDENDEEEIIYHSLHARLQRTPTPDSNPRGIIVDFGLAEKDDHAIQRHNKPRETRRNSASTMPGSLFPRSPSLETESTSQPKKHHVRFSSDSSKSSGSGELTQPVQKSLAKQCTSSKTPPRQRSEMASSIKSVVQKFHLGKDEANPSILFPSPKQSPRALVNASSTTKKGKARAVDPEYERDSGILLMEGKERELVSAREEYKRGEIRLEVENEGGSFLLEQIALDRDRDKAKIKLLEDEIERLKKELLARPTLPPPPPPPPPPPSLRNNSKTADPFIPFAAVRASLKHAPAETSTATVRRPGMPTVGLAPDKMAAFLNELKTVRLRKTSETSKSSLSNSTSNPPIINFPLLTKRRSSNSVQRLPAMTASNSCATLSHASLHSHTGEKRKRTEIANDDDSSQPTKRHSGLSSTDFISGTTPYSSQGGPIPVSSSATAWKTISATDAPTPSLCSDNDIERDDDAASLEAPSTPPIITPPSRAFYRFRGVGIPVESGKSRDVIMGNVVAQEELSSFIRKDNQLPRSNIFDKRPPSSPFPEKSPRRPRRPGRSSRQILKPPPRSDEHSDDEDPLSLSFSSPESSFPHASNADSGRPRKKLFSSIRSSYASKERSSARLSRRLTLEQELRNVSPLSRDQGAEESSESGVLIGVGSMSKRRGFLSHGGAGGIPIFMGSGYVEYNDESDNQQAPD